LCFDRLLQNPPQQSLSWRRTIIICKIIKMAPKKDTKGKEAGKGGGKSGGKGKAAAAGGGDTEEKTAAPKGGTAVKVLKLP
jgi:hypothetical protein